MSYSKIPLSTALVSLSVRLPRFISIPRKNRERHRNRATRRAGKNSNSDREPTGGLANRLWCSIPHDSVYVLCQLLLLDVAVRDDYNSVDIDRETVPPTCPRSTRTVRICACARAKDRGVPACPEPMMMASNSCVEVRLIDLIRHAGI